MLSVRLKEFTKTNHQLLEKKLVIQMKAMQTKQDYAALLGIFYSYFGGLELAMSKHPDLSFLPDYAQRRKSSALANDLVVLDANLPPLALANKLPHIENYLQTIGAMYVMEGSTLGGKFIAKMIQKQLNMEEDTGLSFFKGYGEETENMWQIFKTAIDQLKLKEEDNITVIESANDTFLQFSNWFDNHQ